MEQTCCLIKPDAFPKYTGEIVSGLLTEGFTIDIAGTFRFDHSMVDKFYHEHIGRSYYDNLSNFMRSGPVLGMLLSRNNAISHLRHLMGPAKISHRRVGQIRYALGDPKDTARNCIHGSDSLEAAALEIVLLASFIFPHIGNLVRPIKGSFGL